MPSRSQPGSAARPSTPSRSPAHSRSRRSTCSARSSPRSRARAPPSCSTRRPASTTHRSNLRSSRASRTCRRSTASPASPIRTARSPRSIVSDRGPTKGQLAMVTVQFADQVQQLPKNVFQEMETAVAPAVSAGVRVEYGGAVTDFADRPPDSERRSHRAARGRRDPAARVRFRRRDGSADPHRARRSRRRPHPHQHRVGVHRHRHARTDARHHDRPRRRHRLLAVHRHPVPRGPRHRAERRGSGRALRVDGRLRRAVRRVHRGDRDLRSGHLGHPLRRAPRLHVGDGRRSDDARRAHAAPRDHRRRSATASTSGRCRGSATGTRSRGRYRRAARRRRTPRSGPDGRAPSRVTRGCSRSSPPRSCSRWPGR